MGFISNPNPIMGNDPNDIPRKIEVDSEGNLKSSIVGSLPKDILAEAKTEADAVGGVLTFTENIFVIEIYNRDTVNAGVFTVNGLEINLPASENYMSAIGGIPSTEVAITGSTSYIVNRYEVG